MARPTPQVLHSHPLGETGKDLQFCPTTESLKIRSGNSSEQDNCHSFPWSYKGWLKVHQDGPGASTSGGEQELLFKQKTIQGHLGPYSGVFQSGRKAGSGCLKKNKTKTHVPGLSGEVAFCVPSHFRDSVSRLQNCLHSTAALPWLDSGWRVEGTKLWGDKGWTRSTRTDQKHPPAVESKSSRSRRASRDTSDPTLACFRRD